MDRKKPSGDKLTTPFSSVFGSRGMLAGLVLIAVIIFLVAIILTANNPGSSPALSSQDCGKNVISYVNTNLVEAGSSAVLGTVTEKNGLYQIMVQYQGVSIPLYATKDCTLMFQNPIDLKGTAGTPAQTTPAVTPVASASPAVDLYVMAFCPYGTQAESAMQPVVDLMGTKARITVRYIASVQGTTVGTVSSLHGPSEAIEDLRQLCIARDAPQKLWPYLTAFNRDCYPNWQNATLLDACRMKTLQGLGINAQGIETCANGAAGLGLLSADENLSNANNVQASPTLIINGQIYNGARTPEAYKQAICAHFDTAPAECSVNLSTTGTAATGGCG